MIEKIKITDNSVIEQIRDNMSAATISEKGLMPAGLIGSKKHPVKRIDMRDYE